VGSRPGAPTRAGGAGDGSVVSDQPPPVNEPARIEDQPAAGNLDFDPPNDQLIDKSDACHQTDTDQGRPQPVAAPFVDVDAQLDVTTFDAQSPAVPCPPELYSLNRPSKRGEIVINNRPVSTVWGRFLGSGTPRSWPRRRPLS